MKTENRGGIAANSPYLAFRRRTEKMQTRKNRKNDETSYEKMLKLRRDLSRAVTLLEMIKKREKTKREQLHLSVEVFEKRYQSRDFSGQLLAEYTSQAAKNTRPAFTPLYPSQYSITASSGSGRVGMAGSPQPSQWASNSGNGNGSNAVTISGGYHANQYGVTKRDLDSMNGGSIGASRKEKRQYKKRKHKQQREKRGLYASPGEHRMSEVVICFHSNNIIIRFQALSLSRPWCHPKMKSRRSICKPQSVRTKAYMCSNGIGIVYIIM